MTKPQAEAGITRDSWLGPAIVAVAFVAAAALSWRKWPDVVVDFGAQLYMPWRISQGAVLYRDLFHFAGGPLSQCCEGLLFRIFGASFLTLIVSNMALLAAALWMVYRRFRAASNTWTATMICLAIVLVFAFNEYSLTGNYNYIAPYSEETVDGLLIALFAVGLLSDWASTARMRPLVGAGLCAGAVFLTKPDIFAALMVCALGAFALFAAAQRRGGAALKAVGVFALAGSAAPACFFAYFLSRESWGDSARSVVFGWLPLFNPGVVKNRFYAWCMGLDTPWWHLRQMLAHFVAVVGAIAVYALLVKAVDRFKAKTPLVGTALFLAALTPLVLWAAAFDWRECGASLPLLTLGACVLIAWNRRGLASAGDPVFPLLWSEFALALLAKMGVYSRITHYGFALAMPAFVAAVYCLVWALPALLEQRWGAAMRRLRMAATVALLMGFGSLIYQSGLVYAQKTLPVGQGGDRIFTFGAAVGQDFRAAVEWIESNTRADATVAALPEGSLINYLTRRVNPTPCLSWDPMMMAVFGADRMTAAFEREAPDYICVVERDDAEFGVDYLGHTKAFGGALMEWVKTNYATVELFGNEPLKNGKFGIKILRWIEKR